jgi:hypothetical protein
MHLCVRGIDFVSINDFSVSFLLQHCGIFSIFHFKTDFVIIILKGRRGRDCMVVGCITTYARSIYHQ